MSSTLGNNIKMSIFGESHGAGIGVVLDGLPAGEALNLDEVLAEMARRAPGRDKTATPRRESDEPEILSGFFNGRTTGTPLCALIRNENTHSGDYAQLVDIPRPGHADYTGHVRYKGAADPRGGGHFSGRLTAPMVFAGAVCRQILARRGVTVGAHIQSIHGVQDTPFDTLALTAQALSLPGQKPFPVQDDEAGARMREEIHAASAAGDSVGGVVECAAVGLPAGLGSPIFDGVENRLAQAIFGIPAVRGLEFGAGFAAAALFGSEHNDPFTVQDGQVRTLSNRHGGVLGGITSGMPLCFRVAFKPTPSIFKTQQSVSLSKGEPTPLSLHGRHDPCVVPRAVPVVEAVTAFCLLDIFLD